MQAYVTSDVGMTREINEDYFSVSYPGDEVQLFIIADGMGGYNGGEVASKLAVQSVRNYILSNYEETDKSRESLSEKKIEKAESKRKSTGNGKMKSRRKEDRS